MVYKQQDKIIIEKDTVKLDFLIRNDKLIGICNVEIDNKKIRNSDECIMPEIATPDGFEVDYYKFIDVVELSNEVILKTKPYFKVSHRMEWTEHAMHQRINTSSWSSEAVTDESYYFNWIIKFENTTIAGNEYVGFSYGFEYNCKDKSIYQIEDKATWELGGDITNNTFVMRGSCEHPVFTFKSDSNYYSGWTMKGIANPYIFQHQPLYAQLQGFTYQYDKQNILITKHKEINHVRSLFQKTKHDNKLIHFNQFCFDLTDNIKTPMREILISSTNIDMINHFIKARKEIQDKYRASVSIKVDKARPDTHVETWHDLKIENIPPILKTIKEWGFNRSFIMPLWKSDETEIYPRFKADRENFGVMGNMCCPLELEISEQYGGWEGIKNYFGCTKDLEMETYMWFGSHFSACSPLEKKIPDIFARDVSGQNNRNNYGHVLFAVNQNSKKYQEYLFGAYQKAKECGITGIFRDSHFNMASDTINYMHSNYEKERESTTFDQRGNIDMDICRCAEKDNILSMHMAEIKIQSYFQNQLSLLYYVESMGMLATSMCGTDFDDVVNYEYIYNDVSTQSLNLEKLSKYNLTPYQAYFRGMSARLFYQLNIDINLYPDKEAYDVWWNEKEFSPLLKAYEKVEKDMDIMEVLPDNSGIIWGNDSSKEKILFTYKDMNISQYSPANKIIDVIDNKMADEKLQAYKIYAVN